MKEIWVVEYSKTQDCFHISTITESVITNLIAFYEKTNNDFQIISLAHTYEGAREIANQLSKHASNTKEVA
jgi:hypothetical protein